MTPNTLWSDLRGMDAGQFLATANRVLPPWISLLLVLVIGWQLAKLVWMLVPGPAAGDAVEVPASLNVVTAPSSSVDVQSIADAHLFGVASADDENQPVVAPEITDDLPDTRLTNLVLKGTIASDFEEDSAAIISDGGREELVYAIGDPVATGAKLHAVYVDRVVLNENGRLTNLELPKDFPEGSAPPTRRVQRATTRSVAGQKSSIQQVVAQNISKLSDVIRPTPYFVNGQQQGYRVYPGRDRRQFAALGLRPGDLIKDIDGQSLTDPTQAMQIFQSLGTAEQVSVTVERNGQPETIVLKTSQLDMGGEETE